MSSRKPRSWRTTLVWVVFGFFVVVFTFLHQLQVHRSSLSTMLRHDYLSYDLNAEEPLDPQQICRLPRIHPFDSSILQYLQPPKPIRCKERQPALTFVDQGCVLRFNDTALDVSGYNLETVSCNYQEVVRPLHDDYQVTFHEARLLPAGGAQLNAEFVSVSCHNFAGLTFYTNIHSCVVARAPAQALNAGRDAFSVIIIGIDSLSRLSFIRNLPKTYKYLTSEMGAYVFRGMTKIGDNTFPNLVAILTGKPVDNEQLHKATKGETYDDWPCIWKEYSRHGHATLFAEDRPDIALFNYLRGGFRNPPTDHYLRPFWLAIEDSKVHRLSSSLCFGNVPKHILQLNYSRDFVRRYSALGRPFFGFSFFVELSHDYVSRVTGADEDFRLWLHDLRVSGYLNRTFLFFLSDHGHRFDAMRATLVGRIEERMPFFALAVPPAFQRSHPHLIKNVRDNLQRLTSPFDVHSTLLDVLQLGVSADLSNRTSGLGNSLFNTVSPNRTCRMAGIPEHYCTCEEESPIDVNDSRSLLAARVLVDHINAFLDSNNETAFQCSRFSLSSIRRTDLIVPNKKVVLNTRVYFGQLIEDGLASGMISKLRTVVQASPGEAMFEATLVYREDYRLLAVAGDVSRINPYGSQSWCVDDAVSKKFCFCRNSRPPGS